MARLPPPPTIGRVAPKDGAAEADRRSEHAASEAEDARARAELPSAVVDLPDAWLADVPSTPPPQPVLASRPAASTLGGAPSPVRGSGLPSPFAPPPLPTSPAIAREEDGIEEIEELSLVEDAVSDASPVAPVVVEIAAVSAEELDAIVAPQDAVATHDAVAAQDAAIVAAQEEAPTLARADGPDLASARALAAARTSTAQPSVAASARMDLRRKHLLLGGGIVAAGLLALVIRCATSSPQPDASPSASASPSAPRNVGADADASDDRIAANVVAKSDDAAARGQGVAAANDGASGSEASGDADPSRNAAAAPPSEAAPAPGDAAAPPGDAAAPPAEAADTDDEIAVVDDEAPPSSPAAANDPSGASTKSSARSSSRSDALPTSKPSADANATPEENLALARAAWKVGNAKDTYKYANKSRYKQSTAEANELATLAACKMKLDEAAKSSYKQLEGERKKRARSTCRDFGVRVGL